MLILSGSSTENNNRYERRNAYGVVQDFIAQQFHKRSVPLRLHARTSAGARHERKSRGDVQLRVDGRRIRTDVDNHQRQSKNKRYRLCGERDTDIEM